MKPETLVIIFKIDYKLNYKKHLTHAICNTKFRKLHNVLHIALTLHVIVNKNQNHKKNQNHVSR